MKKKRKMKSMISYFICFCMIIVMLPLHALAAGSENDTKLTIRYGAGETIFSIYKVASFSEKKGYQLETPFIEYENEVYGLDRLNELNANEWRNLAFTLENLVITDNIKPTKVVKTDRNGLYVWEDAPKGLYLIIGESSEDEKFVYSPSPLLVTVPYKDVNDEWNYHVEILHNKYEEEEKEDYIDLGVVKIWIDGEEHEYRPVAIKVALYNGNKLYKTVVLNEDNNWRYEWKDLSADGVWHIREVEVPDGYKTYYTFWDNKFYIVNVGPDDEPEDEEGTTEDQEGTTEDEEGTTEDQEGTTEDQEGTTEDQEGTTEDQEGTTEDQEGTTEDQEGTTEDQEGTTENQEGTTEDQPKPPKPEEQEKIPQTGQLWWPVPILCMLGLLSVTLGLIRRKNGENK